MIKRILYALLFLLIAIQFVRIDTENPELIVENDFLTITQPSEEIASLIKAACYDCHSNETVYPWYSQIAPISWWTKDHINEGRAELNFSSWGEYSIKRKNHKLDECIELVDEGEMPMDSYTWMHAEAKLTDVQRQTLNEFFKSKIERTEAEEKEHMERRKKH